MIWPPRYVPHFPGENGPRRLLMWNPLMDVDLWHFVIDDQARPPMCDAGRHLVLQFGVFE
jgi:hypothetical protein